MANWLLSLSCSGPGPLSANQSPALEWIIYILFSPCSLHILQAALHALFLVVFSVSLLAARRNKARVVQNGTRGPVVAGPLFMATLGVLSIVALLSYASLIWHIWNACAGSGWTSASSGEVVFTAIQALAWTVFAVVVGHELPKQMAEHPLVLRAWWSIIVILATLQFVSAIIRLSSQGFTYTLSLKVDDLLNILIFPVSLFLLIVSVRGPTGLRKHSESGILEPLLSGVVDEEHKCLNVTGFYKATLFNKAFWLWLNPVLTKGANTTLEIDDIPELSPDDRAERLYELFTSNWPGSESAHPSRTTVIKTFKWNFALTASLALVKAISMYVGPLLIQSFSDFLESSPKYYREGILLVAILLVAKFVEVLSTHHYQFLSMKLGMMIRSCLITSIYKKGLKLTNASRQSHGAGQIVNYMTVDVQQISDSIIQINNTWMLPFQVVIALFITYQAVGLAAFAGFATMVALAGIVIHSSRVIRSASIEVMTKKDVRMKATTEVLNFMKVIKLQAWEDYFQKKVESCRKNEYSSLKKFQYALGVNITVLMISTSVVALVTFGVCLLINSDFSAAKAFTVISTFTILSEPIRTFPQAIISVSQALVSLNRLDKYFLSKELEGYVQRDSPMKPDNAIVIENGQFSWDEEAGKPTLHDINFKVPEGALVAIVGTVGSGKSSLLAALLGEIPKLDGYVQVLGTTAYVPQTAWIQSGTVQENILFGKPMDRSRYRQTIKACALEQDIALFEFGDQTEIGERGINLSGGQKQRIQLARAVYQDTDVYFLDDVFSAVDAHTGSALFKDCLLDVLGKKTRVLVTHQVEFLHKVDLILVVQDGVIQQAGNYHDLVKAGAEFGALVAAHKKAIGVTESKPQDLVEVEEVIVSTPMNEMFDESVKLLRRLSSSHGSFSNSAKEVPGKLVEAEKRETGRVGWNVYHVFLTSAYGPFFVVLVLLVQVIAQAFSISSDFWISDETSGTSFDAALFIQVYALLSAGGWLFLIMRSWLLAMFALKTSQKFYEAMLRSIFKAPMSFFDTTPTGRLLTRASTDQATVDIMLPLSVFLALMLYFATIGIVVVTCIVTWPVVFVVIPMGWIYVRYQDFYLRSSREIARLDSITKAPVIHHFTETISGFMVIRGFRKEDEFVIINVNRVNTNLKMDFHSNAANDWLGCRLELIGAFVLCVAALLLVVLPSSFITPSSAALSLSYGLSLNTLLAAAVFFSCTIENKMVSVERIGQYTRLPTEAPLVIEDNRPDNNWPNRGSITIRHLKARYQPTMPLVLKGISVDIVGGQKIGVVGRTGSGKSTLIQVLFRIIEPVGGSIVFDDVDITTIGLHDLRARLGIIPQDPVLFEGTIRTNMDPLEIHTDAEIWEGLRKCQLADIVEARPDKLDAVVLDNGENWSVGQRQLLCLGRALLKKSHILFLDEATASVDAQTDAVLQTVIREEFQNSTVVSIAHRIPTVMDGDMVMVLEAGLLKEYNSPARLLEEPSSLFAALVHEYTARSRS